MYYAHIIARQGNNYIVEDKTGEQHQCHVRSYAIEAVCGDYVECLKQTQSLDVIEKIQPRKNLITRIDNFGREKTLAANIDHMLIVIAATPEFSTLLIDKYLASAQLNQCKASLIINKVELLNKCQTNINELEKMYLNLVDNLIVSSAKLGFGISNLRNILDEDINVLVGQSGVGKSSIINRLLHSSQIKVGTLAENIQQGRHTTTTAYAHSVNKNGKIIDSPGVRTFMPVFKNIEQVMLGFREFIPRIRKCKFNNCLHMNEPNCAIQHAVDNKEIHPQRYENYLSICKELAN